MDKDPFDLVGDVLDGQFRVDSFAGEGDLSVVYKGHHLGVDAPVAIKCLNLPLTLDATHATPLVDGFKDASRIHYRLARGNLNIAQSIASGSTVAPRTGAAVPYLVREWFHGESLSSDLARRRANKMTGRSVAETMALLEAAFDGVSYAHHQGEVHLSLNPNNLFLATKAEGGASLKVLDFGVASAMTDVPAKVPGAPLPPVSRRALRVLFPAYAAPEQLDQGVGPQGPWTDVYALALITLEVLSDRVVMSETDTGALVEHALDDRRRPNPQAHGLKLPRNLELVLTRAVLRSPDRRPKNAAELWRDMKSAVKATASRANMLATEGAGGHTLVPAGPVPGPALRTAPAPTATPVVVPAPGASAMMQVSAIPSAAPSPAPATLPSGPRASAPSDPVVSRSRSATLMGIAAPAVVVGAVGNRLRVPSTPSVETQPMSFEPISSSAILSDRFGVEPVTAVNKAPPAVPGAPVAPLPEMTPSPPAPYAALDPARVPPVAPMADFDDELQAAPSPLYAAAIAEPEHPPLKPSWLPPKAQRLADRAGPRGVMVTTILVGTMGVIAAIIAIVHASKKSSAEAAASAVPAASEVAPAPAPGPPPPTAEAPAASAAGGAASAAPTASAAEPGEGELPLFNAAAARKLLDATGRDMGKCKHGKLWGVGSSLVTFASDGSVAHVAIGTPFRGTPVGDCVSEVLSELHVAPFRGTTVNMNHRFFIPMK